MYTHARTEAHARTYAGRQAHRHACTHARSHTHVVSHRYTHAHMHAVTHAHMHTRPHAHMPTCTHAHMPTCPHAHMHTCTHALMHICTYAYMHLAGGVGGGEGGITCIEDRQGCAAEVFTFGPFVRESMCQNETPFLRVRIIYKNKCNCYLNPFNSTSSSPEKENSSSNRLGTPLSCYRIIVTWNNILFLFLIQMP